MSFLVPFLLYFPSCAQQGYDRHTIKLRSTMSRSHRQFRAYGLHCEVGLVSVLIASEVQPTHHRYATQNPGGLDFDLGNVSVATLLLLGRKEEVEYHTDEHHNQC